MERRTLSWKERDKEGRPPADFVKHVIPSVRAGQLGSDNNGVKGWSGACRPKSPQADLKSARSGWGQQLLGWFPFYRALRYMPPTQLTHIAKPSSRSPNVVRTKHPREL